jgi:hypothetical protein
MALDGSSRSPARRSRRTGAGSSRTSSTRQGKFALSIHGSSWTRASCASSSTPASVRTDPGLRRTLRRSGRLPGRARAAGYPRESIDVVLCTHCTSITSAGTRGSRAIASCRRSRMRATCSRAPSGSTGRGRAALCDHARGDRAPDRRGRASPIRRVRPQDLRHGAARADRGPHARARLGRDLVAGPARVSSRAT